MQALLCWQTPESYRRSKAIILDSPKDSMVQDLMALVWRGKLNINKIQDIQKEVRYKNRNWNEPYGMLLSMWGRWAGGKQLYWQYGNCGRQGKGWTSVVIKRSKEPFCRRQWDVFVSTLCEKPTGQILDRDGFLSLYPLCLMICFTKSSQVMLGQKTASSPLLDHHDRTTRFEPLTEKVWKSWLVCTILPY